MVRNVGGSSARVSLECSCSLKTRRISMWVHARNGLAQGRVLLAETPYVSRAGGRVGALDHGRRPMVRARPFINFMPLSPSVSRPLPPTPRAPREENVVSRMYFSDWSYYDSKTGLLASQSRPPIPSHHHHAPLDTRRQCHHSSMPLAVGGGERIARTSHQSG